MHFPPAVQSPPVPGDDNGETKQCNRKEYGTEIKASIIRVEAEWIRHEHRARRTKRGFHIERIEQLCLMDLGTEVMRFKVIPPGVVEWRVPPPLRLTCTRCA